jgi:hypothetical protein
MVPTQDVTAPIPDSESAIPLASSSNGRVSGKMWKLPKSATVSVLAYPDESCEDLTCALAVDPRCLGV